MEERIKGYVQFFDQKIPVTWRRETAKFVYDVRTIKPIDDEWIVSDRLYEDKMSKKEIYCWDADDFVSRDRM